MDLRNFILPRIPLKEEQLSMLKKNTTYSKEVILKSKMIILKVEIKNKNKDNIMCGCIYRHPNHDMSESINYLECTLKKVSSENKEVYVGTSI